MTAPGLQGSQGIFPVFSQWHSLQWHSSVALFSGLESQWGQELVAHRRDGELALWEVE